MGFWGPFHNLTTGIAAVPTAERGLYLLNPANKTNRTCESEPHSWPVDSPVWFTHKLMVVSTNWLIV